MSCPECFTGYVREGKGKGKIDTVCGYRTYIAEPPSGQPEGIIVFIPDAFNLEFPNNQILADKYAERGNYRVYIPDFMDGIAPPMWAMDTMAKILDTSSIIAWLRKPIDVGWAMYGMLPFFLHNRIPLSEPRVRKFMVDLRKMADEQKLPVGAAGFCWGGHHVVILCHGASDTPLTKVGERPLVDAGFTAHPSFLKIPQELQGLKIPISFAWGDKDMAVKFDEVKKAKVIIEKQKETDTEVILYEGAGHGFAIRADIGNKEVEKDAIKAEEQAINWFKKHFANVKF